MELNEIELLLQKYYEGETTECEENELKHYFTKESDLPINLKSDAALFNTFAAQQQEELDKFLSDDWLFEKIHLSNRVLARRRILPVMKFLTVAASIIFIVGAAFWIEKWYNKPANYKPNMEVGNLQRELHDMKQVLLANGSPSDRIRVTSRIFDPVKDEQAIDILIGTLNQDPNVNVRLAACEALYQFKKNSKAKKGFIESLQYQTDPMVQILLIEILSDLNDRESFQEIRRFMTKANLHPVVREKAEEGLSTHSEI